MTAFMLGLFEVSLTMAAAVFVLLLLSKLFGKRFTSKCRYIVWTLVILRLCVPVGSSLVTPLFSVSLPQSVTVAGRTEETVFVTEPDHDDGVKNEATVPAVTVKDPGFEEDVPSSTPSVGVGDVEIVAPQDTAIQSVAPEAPLWDESPAAAPDTYEDRVINTEAILKIAFVIWAVGATAFLVVRLSAYFVFAGKLKRSKMLSEPSEHTLEIFNGVCGMLGIKKAPKLYVSRVPMSPMLCGFFRPIVIIPDLEYTAEYLAGALTHELTHFKRGDVWVKLACMAAQAVHWFNPMSHIAASKCVSEMELSCDEAVLYGMSESDRLTYGNALLAIVRRSGGVRPSGLTTGMNPRRSAVKERLMNILDMTKKRRGVAVIAAVVALCIAAGAVVGCSFGIAEPDNATYYVPEYMKYAEGNDIYELSLTYENGSISAKRSANGELDAVYTVTFDDEKLSLIEVSSPSGELLRKNVFEYNENGDITSFCYSDAEGTREYRKATFTYDDTGRLVVKEYTEDSSSGIIKESYEYDDNGKLAKVYKYDTTIMPRNTITEYDAAGREIKCTYLDMYRSLPNYHTTKEYELDSEGRAVKEVDKLYRYNVEDPSEPTLVEEKRFSYDENGNVISAEDFIEDFIESDYSNKVEYVYTDDGRHIIEVIDNHPAYTGRFDPETLESDGLYLEGAYIRWRECDKTEYERYLQVYLSEDVFYKNIFDDTNAEQNYLINMEDHAWFMDYDLTENTIPYADFVGINALTEADARKEWYRRYAQSEHGISYNQIDMVEAFLMNDVDALAELAKATDGAYESYRGMKIGDYTIGIDSVEPYDKALTLEVEVLESNNEVLTPGRHKLIAYGIINPYLCTVDAYAKRNDFNQVEDPLHKYVASLVTYGLTDIDKFKEGINDIYRNLATYLAVNRMSVTDSKKYSDLSNLRKEEVEYLGWCSFTADEVAEYADTYFDTKDFVPEKFEFYNDRYSYEFKDGYYINNARGEGRASITFDEDREENGRTVVTATVWADQSATVKSMTVEYHFEMIDGEPKIMETKILYDSGFEPSNGQGT